MDIKFSIGTYLFIYIICLFPFSVIIGKHYIHNLLDLLSTNLPLIYVKIFGGILVTLVFIYVHVVTKKIDYRNYQFDYKRDNIFYTIYEITPFVLILLLVLWLR